MRVSVFCFFVLLCSGAVLASIFTDPGHSEPDDEYDAAVVSFVTELSALADPPKVRDENYVRMLLIADQTFKQLEDSPHRLRYTVGFPIYKDGLHDMFAATAAEFADETTAQHIHDDLQARAAVAREAISLRK